MLGEKARWGDAEHLLAGVIEAIQIGNYYTYVAASDRRFTAKPIVPKPLIRPGDKPPPSGKLGGKASYTTARMREILDNWGAAAGGEFTTEVK